MLSADTGFTAATKVVAPESRTKQIMKVAQIKDIENLADGSIIGEMRVQIKTAFPPKTGQGKYGPWRVQAAILKDSTGECRASFWTNDDMTELTGQTVTIKSQAGAKGLQGLAVKYNDHGKKNELNITDKAAIIDDASGAVNAYVAERVPNIVQKAPVISDPKAAIFQRAQLYVDCLKAAGWVAKQEEITGEHFQAVVASLFISADKAGLYNSYPGSKAAAPAPAPKPEPADEIPMGDDEFAKEAGW